MKSAVTVAKTQTLMEDNISGVVASSRLIKVPIEDTKKWDSSLKVEIINWDIAGEKYELEINRVTDKYAEQNFERLVTDQDNNVKEMYYVESSGLENKEYIYDGTLNIVYKVEKTMIDSMKVHSIEELDYLKSGNERRVKRNYTKISHDVNIVEVNNIKYYEPDITGYGQEVTTLIFYETEKGVLVDNPTTYEMTATEWLQSKRPNKVIKGEKEYTLYDYANKIWANIKVVSAGIETDWVWIPRYAYYNEGTTTHLEYITVDNTKTDGSAMTQNYKVAPTFDTNTRKGIWVSKYEPVQEVANESAYFEYYIPDLTGFELGNTYLQIYDKKTDTFIDEKQASTISNLTKFSFENLWFDYDNKIWANIRVEKNGIETWWVWIPRYAYRNDGTSTDIIFIDQNNKLFDGSEMPESYTVAPSFEGNTRKGIWASKYEVVEAKSTYVEELTIIPDLTGFELENTYLQIYDKETKTFVDEKQASTIDNLEAFTKENLWYDYDNKIWANIRVEKNGIETWWVWIPRYAYINYNSVTDIIYITEDNKTLQGEDIPESYTIAPAFEGNTRKGIWTSKYEPVN